MRYKLLINIVLRLVTMTDRDGRLKPRMREFFKELRQVLTALMRAGWLECTPDQVAFILFGLAFEFPRRQS